jgi:hypothetical protein
VEEKPPQQKPIGTAFRKKRKQNVQTNCVLTGDVLAARLFGIQKNRRIERVHARFANLNQKNASAFWRARQKLGVVLRNQSNT